MTLESARLVREREGAGGRGATRFLPPLVVLLPVAGLGAAQGGYFPTAWGWASVPLLWTAATALIVRREIRLNGHERIFLALLAALSSAWSLAFAESVAEFDRALVYLAAAAAALFLSRGRSARYVLGGLLTAISLIATFSLLTRLAPDRVGLYDRTSVYRLAGPIRYWNGLGIFPGNGGLLPVA